MAFLFNKPKVANKDDAKKLTAEDYLMEVSATHMYSCLHVNIVTIADYWTRQDKIWIANEVTGDQLFSYYRVFPTICVCL